jgi:HlyD family secretion protein
MKIPKKQFLIPLTIALLVIIYVVLIRPSDTKTKSDVITELTSKRSFDIEVRSVGELEASRSTLIMSPIRGDLGKIISIISDGTYVKPGDLLVKLDPTPFEESIADLQGSIREQECKIKALEQTLESEICQVEHETKTCEFELRSADLELEKIIKGDGPQEMARLQSTMQKALSRFEEIQGYSQELETLENEGFLSTSELNQARKKLKDEEEACTIAKLEYDSFMIYVQPMRIEKAQTALKRATSKLEETIRLGKIKVIRDEALLDHSKEQYSDLKQQLLNALAVLSMTDIKAPAPGIVVLKEEFRNGQKRKPRVGDQVIRNQPLLDLPDLDSMIVKTKVREADLFKIGIGKPATVSLDAYPQLSLKGKVISIGVLALTDSSKMGEEKYFDVLISIDQGDPRLRPGMTARANILANQIKNSLSIPIHAVFENEKTHYCYLKKGSGFITKPIQIGASNEYWAQVISGLDEGENVCLSMPPKEHLQNKANDEL